MDSWQRDVYKQIESFVVDNPPLYERDEAKIAFNSTQAYLIKTIVDNQNLEIIDLELRLTIAHELNHALRDNN